MVPVSETSSLLPSSKSRKDDPKDFENQWLFPVLVTTTILVPTLVGCVIFLIRLTDRLYPATLCAIHMSGALLYACWQTSKTKNPPRRFVTSFLSIIDVYLCAFVYPGILNILASSFLDIDGTPVPDWLHFHRQLWVLLFSLHIFVIFRLLAECNLWLGSNVWLCRHGFNVAGPLKKSSHLKERLRKCFLVLTLLSLVLSCLCLLSCARFLWWQPKGIETTGACCDDMDETECALPFPSFHHMRQDSSSRTGWRVNLQGKSLPPMKSGDMNLSFLNDLDGFSPMSTILFYLEGMKEMHKDTKPRLETSMYPTLAYDFQDSTTDKSITLLWNVNQQELVPHTARVDYLDPDKPIILLAPSKPLQHGTHYAVAVANAIDKDGNQIPATPGMQRLLSDSDARTCSNDHDRTKRFHELLFPSLQKAAPWISDSDKEENNSSLQLVFDFVTMSDDSLYEVRTVRDATLQQISDWEEHSVQITKVVDGNCNRNESVLARTIHGSLSVPWWLNSERRDSVLSRIALEDNRSNGVGQAKFSIYVPCSLYAAAVNDTSRIQRPLRAIVEYGHGVFNNRQEASEYSLLRVAEDEGYLVMAMDWRGMSSFDLPVVLKGLLANPNWMRAIRDNMIQGYACKLVMQHFAKHGLLDKEWLHFSGKGSSDSSPIPLFDDSKPPISVFYGNSQGGIFGAAYTALLGKTGLIDRGILGTPGTPYFLVMYQSNKFDFYDALMMQNFYNNRHIRMVFTILQMALDPVEPSSLLAPPVKEPYPPMLIQSGLGDPVIYILTTEALARAYNASILPNNPRKNIFGISMANGSMPHVAWTELLYEDQYELLQVGDVGQQKANRTVNMIHECLRQDCALIDQMSQFINDGLVIDPCRRDQCLRKSIACRVETLTGSIYTKPRDWTCAKDNE